MAYLDNFYKELSLESDIDKAIATAYFIAVTMNGVIGEFESDLIGLDETFSLDTCEEIEKFIYYGTDDNKVQALVKYIYTLVLSFDDITCGEILNEDIVYLKILEHLRDNRIPSSIKLKDHEGKTYTISDESWNEMLEHLIKC